MEGCGWLLWTILWADREQKPTTSGQAGTVPGPCDEGCLAEGPYPWLQSSEEDLHLGPLRPSQFHQQSRQHMILGLNLGLTQNTIYIPNNKNFGDSIYHLATTGWTVKHGYSLYTWKGSLTKQWHQYILQRTHQWMPKKPFPCQSLPSLIYIDSYQLPSKWNHTDYHQL